MMSNYLPSVADVIPVDVVLRGIGDSQLDDVAANAVKS